MKSRWSYWSFALLFSMMIVPVSAKADTDKTYEGREADAPWRLAAKQRIEKYRKGDLSIRVLDAAGNPVPDAKVDVEQTRHAFGFGAAIGCYAYQRPGEHGDLYRKLIDEVFRFNEIVFENDIKPKRWHQYATGENPKKNWDNVEKSLQHFEAQGIPVRGHYLVHGNLKHGGGRWSVVDYRDDFAKGRTYLEGKLIAEATVRADKLGDRVIEWDALNHAAGWGTKDMKWLTMTQDPAYAVRMLKALRKVVPPSVKFFVNEGNVLSNRGNRADQYFGVTKALLDAGVPIDGIGFMGHYAIHHATGDIGRLTPPAMQVDILKRFATFGLRMKITEYDVDAGDDDQLQADFLRDSMIAAFAEPAVDSFVMWGFWEGKHWRKAAALVRRDGTLKPSGEIYLDLVYNQWWTDEQVTTNAKGVAKVPAFYGKYDLIATIDGKPVMVSIDHTSEHHDPIIVQAPK